MRRRDTGRFQINYSVVRQRYTNSVKNACIYLETDVDSNLNCVALKAVVKLKKFPEETKKGNGISEK